MKYKLVLIFIIVILLNLSFYLGMLYGLNKPKQLDISIINTKGEKVLLHSIEIVDQYTEIIFKKGIYNANNKSRN